jgi:hypothetical protein
MTDATRAACPDCAEPFEQTDNYCRRCGMYLAVLRDAVLPAPTTTQALTAPRPMLPAPAKKVVTALAIGTALQVGVGIAGKVLAAQAARKALMAPAPRAVSRKRASKGQSGDIREDADALSETVLIRRVWIRRG